VKVAGVTGFTPTGSVSVSDGHHRICSIPSLSPTGRGKCTITEPKGQFLVTATYSGDSNYGSASGNVSETVK